MGYFSNGEEGNIFEEQYCDRCVHLPEASMCPVMDLHLMWNYDACNEPNDQPDCHPRGYTLNLLIPMSDDGLHNKACRMFHAE